MLAPASRQQRSYGTYEGVEKSREGRGRGSVAGLVVLVVGGTLFAGGVLSRPRTRPSPAYYEMLPETVVQRSCSNKVCVVASNAYERRLGRSIANGAYKGIVLELHVATQIEASGAKCVVEGLEVIAKHGCAMEVVARKVGTMWMSVDGVDFELTARYVRREVRDLEADDRTRFLDAIRVTHETPDDVGMRLYGERYRSSAWFAAEHLKWSGERGCDHWHANSDFLNSHMALTLRFEHSLQAIDPRTCVHYWDFTIDEATRDCCWADSILWSPDWFSTINPNNTLRVVDVGRWAFTKIPYVNTTLVQTHNPYGLLTAPWNTNPTPYLTRSQTLWGEPNYISIPSFGCGDFRQYLLTSLTFESLLSDLSGNLHAPVHGMIGGYWNFLDELKENQNAVNAQLVNVTSGTDSIKKKLWRKGFVECPSFCADDAPAVNCSCELAKSRIDAVYPNISAYQLLNISGALDQYEDVGVVHWDENLSSPLWDKILHQVANGGHAGTADNDGSPLDPIFWVIHGVQERFMQLVRFLNDTDVYDFKQKYVQTRATSQGVAQWGSNRSFATSFPYYNQTGICTGHLADDLVAYPFLLEGQSKAYLTNAEFFNMTRPFSPHLPYVYDQILNWTQCGWLMGAPLAAIESI